MKQWSWGSIEKCKQSVREAAQSRRESSCQHAKETGEPTPNNGGQKHTRFGKYMLRLMEGRVESVQDEMKVDQLGSADWKDLIWKKCSVKLAFL